MAAGPTYEPIATTTFSTTTANVTYNSLGSYTDLRIICSVIGTSSSQDIALQFNGDTGTNYSQTQMYGNGSSAISDRESNATFMRFSYGVGNATTIPGLSIIDIFSYAGSTNKTALGSIARDANGSGVVNRVVGLWRNTAAITSIKVFCSTGSFISGDTITLYGIKAA